MESKSDAEWDYCWVLPGEGVALREYMFKFHIPKGGATNSDLYGTMTGEKGQTKEFLIVSDGMEQGNPVFTVRQPDIGKVTQLDLRIEGQDSFLFEKVQVISDTSRTVFDNIKNLQTCHGGDRSDCRVKLTDSGGIEVKVNLKSLTETRSVILVKLKGEKGLSEAKRVNFESIKDNSEIERTFNFPDLGQIKGYEIDLEGDDKWFTNYMKITRMDTKEEKLFQIDPKKEISASSSSKKNVDEAEKEEVDPESRVIMLECEQNVEDIAAKLGPAYATSERNTDSFKVQCPPCFGSRTTVLGMGVHPSNSPICESGIIDKTCSVYGCSMELVLFSGKASYEIPESGHLKVENIEAKAGTKKNTSYALSKLNSPDFIDSEARILNEKGVYSSEGRFEVRINGKWGAICKEGNNPVSASVACKMAGFSTGVWIENSCNNHNGGNYCGTPSSTVFYENVQCTTKDMSLNTCSKKRATCDFTRHALISCKTITQEGYKGGDVKLEPHDKCGKFTCGIVQMYNGHKWGRVAGTRNRKDAQVICKSLGYTDGWIDWEWSMVGFGDYETKDFHCSGTESHTSKCSYHFSHFHFAWRGMQVKCEGSDGKPDGSGQLRKFNSSAYPQKGKLVMPVLRLRCEDTGENKKIRGDQGSAYLVECPYGCERIASSLWGYGIYSSDTNICAAGVQMGIISKSSRTMVLTRSYGIHKYEGRIVNGVKSIAFEKWNKTSFYLTKTNDEYFKLAEIEPQSSFMEMKSELGIEKPDFEWFPRGLDFKFDNQSSITNLSLHLNKKPTFTMVMTMRDNSSISNERCVFSLGEDYGFQLVINKTKHFEIHSQATVVYTTKFIIPMQRELTVVIQNDDAMRFFFYDELSGTYYEEEAQLSVSLSHYTFASIGQNPISPSTKFNGLIKYVGIYPNLIDKATAVKLPSVRFTNALMRGTKEGVFTVSNKKCISKVFKTNPTPAEIENKLKEILSKNGSIELTGLSELEKMAPPKEKKDAPSKFSNNCEGKLEDMPEYSPKEGTEIRINCSKCLQPKGSVFGYDVYHPHSNPCMAAFNSNVLTRDSENMDIVVSIVKGINDYASNAGANGVKSYEYFGISKVAFKVGKAAPATKATCESTLNEGGYRLYKRGDSFQVNCPAGCVSSNAPIYGKKVYSDNSSICRAAIHFGMIGDTGGEVNVLVKGIQLSFPGEELVDGIMSDFGGTSQRSFTFGGNASELDASLTVTSNKPLAEQYEIGSCEGAQAADKSAFTETNVTLKDRKQKGIQYQGHCSSPQSLRAACWAKSKLANSINGDYRFSLIMNSSGQVHLMSRFSSPNDYIGLEVDIGSLSRNLTLYQKENGSNTVLGSKAIHMSVKTHYDFSLTVNGKNVEVGMKTSTAALYSPIISTTIAKVKRGSFAIGTNGNKDFTVYGISAGQHDSLQSELERMSSLIDYDGFFTGFNEHKRKKYCYKLNHKNKISDNQRQTCHLPINFARIVCTLLIHPKIEKFRYYACFKRGVIDISHSDPIEEPEKPFKPGDKIDFKPEKRENYFKGRVIKKIDKEHFDVVFQDVDGSEKPEKNAEKTRMTHCGVKLNVRTDCLAK